MGILLDAIRLFGPWDNPNADEKHTLCHLLGFSAMFVLPILQKDEDLGCIYNVAVLLLNEDGSFQLVDDSTKVQQIMVGREQDDLPLSDPIKLEMLVETLASISTLTFWYRLYRNTPTKRVIIVREEVEVEPPPLPARVEIADEIVKNLRVCNKREYHSLGPEEMRIPVINGPAKRFAVCLDCGGMVEK